MAPRQRIDRTAALLVASGALAAAGCSAEQYKKDADHEVAEILAKKQKDFHKFSEDTGFTIEQAHDALRAQLVSALAELNAAHQGEPPVHRETSLAPPESSRDQADEALRDRMVEIRQERARHLAEVEKAHAADLTPFQANDPSLLPAKRIRLLDAVAIAAENNRDYQRQKEQVYLSALDLTFQRYQFENHYGVTSDYQWSSIDNPGDAGRTRQGSLTTSLSVTRKLETGGLLVFDRLVQQHAGHALHWYAAAAPMAEAPTPRRGRPAGGKRAPKGQGAHRHKFDERTGVCACGAKRRRAPKGSGAASAEARTLPLLGGKSPIGDHARDKFEGGAFGSSGTGDR